MAICKLIKYVNIQFKSAEFSDGLLLQNIIYFTSIKNFSVIFGCVYYFVNQIKQQSLLENENIYHA